MDQDDMKKWEDIMTMMSGGDEISLGECLVTATMIEGNVAIVISNMFGMGFDMVMPACLDEGVKEAIISMAESSSMDPAIFGEESLKKSFVSGYINTLLPEISQELREMVSRIEPFKAVLSIMSYLNLFEDAMSSNDTDSVTLGPDGNIYVDADEMPFSHNEISEQIAQMSGLSDSDVAIMRRWIPAACKMFDGVFPGYICEDDGIGVKVKIVSLDMSRAFSSTVEDFWGEGPGDDSEIDMDAIIDMVKRSSPGKVVSKKPVEDALGMMDLAVLTPRQKDAMRETLLKAYAGKGEPVPADMAIPSDMMDGDGAAKIVDLIKRTEMEKEDFPFICVDGGIIYVG